jgi:hypothetical protein
LKDTGSGIKHDASESIMLPFTIPDALRPREAGFPAAWTGDLAPKEERMDDGSNVRRTWKGFEIVSLAAGAPRRSGFAGERHAR